MRFSTICQKQAHGHILEHDQKKSMHTLQINKVETMQNIQATQGILRRQARPEAIDLDLQKAVVRKLT